MSVISVSLRGLEQRLKRFFNTIAVLPVRILTVFRVVVPYENALHRLFLKSTEADALDFGTTGYKSMFVVPVGEIWILEHVYAALSTGTTVRLDSVSITRKDMNAGMGLAATFTPVTSFHLFRGVDFSVDNWLYLGDEMFVRVSTNNAGDKGLAMLEIRRLRVGDDF